MTKEYTLVDGFSKPPLCPWCSAPWTSKMIEVEAMAGGGCDTCGYGGEPHGTVTINCESCKKLIYQKDFDHRY